MPIITDIKQQKNKNRVNVYLDGKFGFGIDLDNFVLSKLRINQELTQNEVEEVVKKAEFQKALEKLIRFAMVRPRSVKEVKDYFRRKQVHESITVELIAKLKHLELINDMAFAKWWIDQRIKTKSLKVIKLELQQKGIDRNTIEDSFEGVEVNEEKLAKDLLDKKMYKWKDLEPRLKKQKMSQYLAGKGFSWGVIETVIHMEGETQV